MCMSKKRMFLDFILHWNILDFTLSPDMWDLTLQISPAQDCT